MYAKVETSEICKQTVKFHFRGQIVGVIKNGFVSKRLHTAIKNLRT